MRAVATSRASRAVVFMLIAGMKLPPKVGGASGREESVGGREGNLMLSSCLINRGVLWCVVMHPQHYRLRQLRYNYLPSTH